MSVNQSLQYDSEFSGDKKKNALTQVLDIRKFEIELYWKRATYFWTFIAAALAGFVAVQASSATNKFDLSVVISCLGIVFSVGWFCVNRGSKHWQENWENHLDMLEDEELGPLYKVVITRAKPNSCKEWFQHIISGPSQFSVSKVNQIISLYVSILWIGLLFYSLPEFDINSSVNWFYISIITLTFMACICFFTIPGRTDMGGAKHYATRRKSCIDSLRTPPTG